MTYESYLPYSTILYSWMVDKFYGNLLLYSSSWQAEQNQSLTLAIRKRFFFTRGCFIRGDAITFEEMWRKKEKTTRKNETRKQKIPAENKERDL